MSKAPATRPERVLFVHAHPDDETLVSGGTIATLLELGAEVTVLTATRGGNDAAYEVLTEARLLLVENYFQTPSLAWAQPWPLRISGRAPARLLR